jgi:hypothetical protein
VAVPDAISSAPDAPLLDTPVIIARSPDTPEDPESAVLKPVDPVTVGDSPDCKTMIPPLVFSEAPPTTESSPPLVENDCPP